RPATAGFVVIQCDCSGEHPLDSYPVAPHHNRDFGAVGKKNPGPHTVGIFGSKLENMTDLASLKYIERAFAVRTRLTLFYRSEARPLVYSDVSFDRHTTKMVIVLVRAGGHIASTSQRLIGDHSRDPWVSSAAHTHRTKRSRRSAEGIANLLGLCGSYIDCATRVDEFGLVQLVVSAHQNQSKLVVEHITERFFLSI